MKKYEEIDFAWAKRSLTLKLVYFPSNRLKTDLIKTFIKCFNGN